MIEGVKIMYATNVAYSEEIQHDPVEVLDQFDVAEFVPVALISPTTTWCSAR